MDIDKIEEMMSHTKELLSSNLHRIRKEKNMTQEKLAELTELTPLTIHNIETKKSHPELETMCKIAIALGVNTEDLYTSSNIDIGNDARNFDEMLKTVKEIVGIGSKFLMNNEKKNVSYNTNHVKRK